MIPTVSIVCVSYRRRDLLLRCLRSCIRQDYPGLEIVLVVNASGDGTEKAVRDNFPSVRLLRTHRNLGFFPALNIAIANAKGDYVMTVDDDAYFVDDHAICDLVRAFREEPRLGAVTCTVEGPDSSPVSDRDSYIAEFKTGFTMMPAQVFNEWIGYYPDLFFRSAGERYICHRLWDLGRPVKRLRDVRMYHELAMQGRSDWDWKFHSLRSQILCCLMREPWYLIAPSLAAKAVRSFGQYTRWRHLSTWMRAWLSASLHVSDAWKHRHPIRWTTRRLIWHLEKDVVTDLEVLVAAGLLNAPSKDAGSPIDSLRTGIEVP